MIHKGKPDLAVAILGKPKDDGAPAGAEPGAEEQACKELWEAIKGDDYDAFHEALDAWLMAKESAPHREGPHDDGEDDGY